MTKSDIIDEIAKSTGIDKITIQKTVEAFMDIIKDSLIKDNNVYLRGFGSFIIKRRAGKTARNISKNATIIIPEHFVPSFKPAKTFVSNLGKISNISKVDDDREDGTDDTGPRFI